jgi:hypothetical protein
MSDVTEERRLKLKRFQLDGIILAKRLDPVDNRRMLSLVPIDLNLSNLNLSKSKRWLLHIAYSFSLLLGSTQFLFSFPRSNH